MNRTENKTRQSREEDFSLINDFLANDRTAFNRLVIKYKDNVFNLCFRILGDYDEANDCAQETFIKVFNNLIKFKFQSGFSTWLYRITINTCKNKMSSSLYRRNKKTISIENPGLGEKTNINNSGTIDLADNSSNPEKIFEKKEKERFIQDAIDSLPGKQKILVVLRDIEGRSYEDIVNITGINMGTVKSKLARARRQLRDRLRGVI